MTLITVDQNTEEKESRQEQASRYEGMLAILRRSEERLKNMPVRGSTEETLKMIRQARAGEMWGYKPTESLKQEDS